ncbi:MAG: S41 family peptidase [Chitinophagaceae bacterium]
MRLKLLVFSVFLLSVTPAVFGQLPDSVRAHIDSSLAILKAHSLYGNKVAWPEIEKQVYDKARTATAKAQTFEALSIAFEALGDKHAAYYQYDDEYKVANPGLLSRYSDSIKAAWSRGPRILSQMIGDIAYLNIPFIGVSRQQDIDKFANWIYDAVAALQKKNPKGWIIDLRLNGGGNIRPMLAGLAPFFNDGIVSYYIDRDGNATDEAAFRNGDFIIDGVSQATIKNKIPAFKPVKVAVLIGPGTASSGEGVAVVFGQRKKTRLFGERSAGLANATNGFVFNDRQSYYLISTACIGNKKKKVLPEYVIPDVIITGNDAFANPAGDTVVQAAMQWLK